MGDNILNKDLYKKAVKQADETYKKPSAYKSMYIQKIYKELGGKYKNKKNKNASLVFGIKKNGFIKWHKC